MTDVETEELKAERQSGCPRPTTMELPYVRCSHRYLHSTRCPRRPGGKSSLTHRDSRSGRTHPGPNQGELRADFTDLGGPLPSRSPLLHPSLPIHPLESKRQEFACPLLPKQSTAFYWRYNVLQESATSLAKNSRQHRSRILRARTLLGDTYFPVQPHPHCHLYLDAER